MFGPTSTGEPGYAHRLLPLLDDTILLLADRAFSGDEFLNAVADRGAQLLVRATYRRRPAVLATLPDGSYLTACTAGPSASSKPTSKPRAPTAATSATATAW